MTSASPKVSIETASYPPVYYPGSVIKGNVVIELSERMSPIRSIMVTLSGKVYTFWTQKERLGKHYHTIPYTYSEKILDVRLDNVLPTRQPSTHNRVVSTQSIELGPGRHKFPFVICLSKNLTLPTSFEYTDPSPFMSRLNGYIRYMLATGISLSSGQKYIAVKGITVISNIDTNTPKLLRPLLSSNEKTICCLCCASGPVSMTVSTDRSGYCSGESICINVDVENHSKRRIVEMQASLKQTIVFYGNPEWHGLFRSLVLSRLSSKTYKTDKIIKKIAIPADAQTMLLPVPLAVPTTTSSICSGIQVFYTLDVILVIRNALDLHVEFPIVIGTIPFRGPNINANPALSHPHFNRPAQERSNLNHAPVSTKQVYIGFDAYTQGDLYYTLPEIDDQCMLY